MATHTEKQDDTQLTRLQALKNEIGAMTPVQRDFISGRSNLDDLLADTPATRSELREQAQRLNMHNTRANLHEDMLKNIKHKAEVQDIDMKALQARVRRLENGVPITEIAMAGLFVIGFTSLIVAIAKASVEPV